MPEHIEEAQLLMTALYLIAALLVLVWGALLLLRGSLLAGCLAYLITAIVFGHDFWNVDRGPLPLTLDRIVLAGLGPWQSVSAILSVASTPLALSQAPGESRVLS